MRKIEDVKADLIAYDYAIFEAERELSYAKTKDEISSASKRVMELNKHLNKIKLELELYA